MRILFTALLVLSLIASPLPVFAKDGFSRGVTAEELRQKYAKGSITVLLVVGHEPMYGGAVYKGVYEREIVFDIATELNRLLSAHTNYEVILSRDASSWNSKLAKHFIREEKDIKKFVRTQKEKMVRFEREGDNDAYQIQHAIAPDDVAFRLYGINHWANEKADLVIHLHVNDAPDHGPKEPSRYTGFAIYVPDELFGNSKASIELGKSISNRLLALGDYSTLPGEGGGVVPSRELIAIGSNGSLRPPSVLVEYGYITEPRFALSEYRQTVTKDAAYQTYLALQDFFGDEVKESRTVSKLPAFWPTSDVVAPVLATVPACAPFSDTLLPAKNENDSDATGAVMRLQALLAKDRTIYPEGLVTGYFGPATKRAVEAFQKKYNIVSSGTPETTGYGAVGPKTSAALMGLCSIG